MEFQVVENIQHIQLANLYVLELDNRFTEALLDAIDERSFKEFKYVNEGITFKILGYPNVIIVLTAFYSWCDWSSRRRKGLCCERWLPTALRISWCARTITHLVVQDHARRPS